MRPNIFLALLPVLFVLACKNTDQAHDAHEHAGHDDELRLVAFDYDPEAYEAVPLNYQIYGEGDTTLFFVHGWNIDQTYWAPQVDYFAPRYRVVTLDLPGHGKSEKGRRHWTPESYARDLRAVVEKENLKNVILIGHSMGGDFTLQTALMIPERVVGLVGVDNYKNIDFVLNDEARFQLSGFINTFEEDYAQSAEGFARQYLLDKTEGKDVIDRVITDYKKADPQIAVEVLKYTFASSARIKERLSKLHVPLLLISCSPGEVNEGSLRKACAKGLTIRYMENTGHFPMIERPGVFNEILTELLGGKK